jgi:nucleotide-binding universal stress UspA family protein
MKLLIAYDGSSRSGAAIDDLRRAALGPNARADVVSVAEAWIPPASSYAGPTLVELALRDIAEKGAAELDRMTRCVEAAGCRIRELFPDWSVETHVKVGPAALRIIELAERWRPELVVVGAQAHVVSDRLGLGSVALKLLTNLRCPVRIARPSEGRPDRLRILVAADGSLDANAAVAAVAARSWPAGTEARVITALHHPVLSDPESGAVVVGPFAAADAENISNIAADKLRLSGLKAAAQVVVGDPKRAVIRAAREWDADCIFCGARGISRAERFLLGSVSTSVAMHAPCSVEVIHPHAV